LTERDPNDDAHRQVNDISSQSEFLELLKHDLSPPIAKPDEYDWIATKAPSGPPRLYSRARGAGAHCHQFSAGHAV
jgi:hypothetical protein